MRTSSRSCAGTPPRRPACASTCARQRGHRGLAGRGTGDPMRRPSAYSVRRRSAASLTCMQGAAAAQEPRLAEGYWTRGLVGAGGHAWKHGVPGYGKTESDVRFATFHPQLGRFVTDHLELYGEGTLLLYARPAQDRQRRPGRAGWALPLLARPVVDAVRGRHRRDCSGHPWMCRRSSASSTSRSCTAWASAWSRRVGRGCSWSSGTTTSRMPAPPGRTWG